MVENNTISYNLLYELYNIELENGLKHKDYSCYRRAISNKLRKLRKICQRNNKGKSFKYRDLDINNDIILEIK